MPKHIRKGVTRCAEEKRGIAGEQLTECGDERLFTPNGERGTICYRQSLTSILEPLLLLSGSRAPQNSTRAVPSTNSTEDAADRIAQNDLQ